MSWNRFSCCICATSDELVSVGRLFSEQLSDGDVCILCGDLGSGKTTFAQGVASGLNISPLVTSPTYNIMSIYQGNMQMVHIDAYRLSVGDQLDIFEFVKSPYIVMVEWPERLQEVHGMETWRIDINILSNNDREVIIYKKEKKL